MTTEVAAKVAQVWGLMASVVGFVAPFVALLAGGWFILHLVNSGKRGSGV